MNGGGLNGGGHSILNGVNGWSFDGVQSSGPISSISMGLDHDYYSTPSAIVTSARPPPCYSQIVENEKILQQERDQEMEQDRDHGKENRFNALTRLRPHSPVISSRLNSISSIHSIQSGKQQYHERERGASVVSAVSATSAVSAVSSTSITSKGRSPRPATPITRRDRRNRRDQHQRERYDSSKRPDIIRLNRVGRRDERDREDRKTRRTQSVPPNQPHSDSSVSASSGSTDLKPSGSSSILEFSSYSTTKSSHRTRGTHGRTRSASHSQIDVLKLPSSTTPNVSTTSTGTSGLCAERKRSISPGLQRLNQLSFVGQSWNDSISTVECEVSDTDSLRGTTPLGTPLGTRKSRMSHRLTAGSSVGSKGSVTSSDIVLSSEIRRYHKSSHRSSLSTTGTAETELADITNLVISKRDEFNIFKSVMDDTRLGLRCNRRYSFSLIHPNREYILSAEHNQELKEWISIFNKLVQGKPLYSGYLALQCDSKWSRKFFILFENKVLNYYRDHNEVSDGTACEFDIDLRHVMWLRFTKKNEFNVDLERHFGGNKDESTTTSSSTATTTTTTTGRSTKSGNSKENGRGKGSNSYFVPASTAMFVSTASGNSVINPMQNGSNLANYAQHRQQRQRRKSKGQRANKKKSKSVYSIEIAVPNRSFLVTAPSQRIRNGLY